MKLTISVLVPTYRRPYDLLRCLKALSLQQRLADEIVIVVRDTDAQTWEQLHEWEQASKIDSRILGLKTVSVAEPGQVAALNTGLKEVSGEIVAITDDDAAPRPDWLERIEAHFLAEPEIVGVGGRDWVHSGEEIENGSQNVVGKLVWHGKLIGNHHLGAGIPREVDVLKGVNCAYRRQYIQKLGWDVRLHGSVHHELGLGLALRRLGCKLVYDPAVAVDHYPGTRFDNDPRGEFNALSLQNAIHNETLLILEHLPPLRKTVFLFWAVLVGTRAAYGLIQVLRFFSCQGGEAFARFVASMKGRLEGWTTWRAGRNPSI